ncbi:MAG: S8/S53 family peptidase, partial [Acidobacteriota bacterium]
PPFASPGPLAAAPASPAAAQERPGDPQPEGCGVPTSTGVIYTSFTCGDLGRFTFSSHDDILTSQTTSCSATDGATETPATYSSVTPLPPISSGQPLEPCSGGSCAATLAPSAGDWVAVIDWDDWHGRSVSWAIQSLSGVRPVLYDLAAGGPPGATSDVHVLEALCGVIDDIDAPGVKPPAAVNLSFGRVDGSEEREHCESTPAGGALGCKLSDALAEIRRSSPIFAAAGNHDTLLFPAADGATTAVGGLDVAWFTLSDIVMTSWQTPDLAEDLMPASGLCFDDQNGDPWAAPSGSSWASAIMSAWYAYAKPPRWHVEAQRWRPQATGQGDYVLANSLGEVPNSSSREFNELFDRLRDLGNGNPCLQSVQATEGVAEVRAERIASGLDATPLVFLDRTATGPTPDPEPCMPCTGGWDDVPDDPGGLLIFAAEEQKLRIGLSHSPGVPSDLRLVGLQLIINRGAQLFTLAPVGIQPESLFRQLELAQLGELHITDLHDEVYEGDEINLIYLYRRAQPSGGGFGDTLSLGETEGHGGAGDGTTYWSATPIDITIE